MIAFRVRLAAMVALGFALSGVLSWTAGLWPNDQPRAVIDHCYVTYDRLEVMHSRCIGNWTRGGRGHQGPIYGVDVKASWQAMDEEPNSAYEWEVAIPESVKQPRVLADSRQAWMLSTRALPWGMVPATLGALLVALVSWSIVAVAWPSARAEPAGSTAPPV
ncbi:hypothetical protein [Micromonospora inositola]|uniref:Uncharacterized protein n=1 Tax=Micromonospora inositola TaxID=47865 RepID=A0A1C5K5R6_9ACTN|nr:hypothetical protein [Micromonospora inositola]SCG78123.1 hypothetical protein GA0070613_6470 [Micromonospora inositola]